VILSLLLSCYTGLLIILITTIVLIPRHNKTVQKTPAEGVSIIIPFRNEEKNLSPLISSLEKQNYSAPIHIIFINDNSTDKSIEIIHSHSRSSRLDINLIESNFNKSRNLTSKQQALDKGIRGARYDWIILTDADMQFESDWLLSLMRYAKPGTDLVFGHTSITFQNNILSSVQAFQLEFLFAVAYSFHKIGIPSSCMGNNLLINRNAYLDVGGYDKTGYSITEDQLLYAEFRKQKKKILCAEPFIPKAWTYPVSTFGNFLHQVRRWFSGGFQIRSGLTAIGLFFLIQNLSTLVLLAGILPPLPLTLTISNLFLTWIFVAVSFKKTASTHSAMLFPLFYFFLLFEFVILICSFIFQPFTIWKGRRI